MNKEQYAEAMSDIDVLMMKPSEELSDLDRRRLDYLWTAVEEYEREESPIPLKATTEKKQEPGCLTALVYMALMVAAFYFLFSALVRNT